MKQRGVRGKCTEDRGEGREKVALKSSRDRVCGREEEAKQ